MCRVIAVNFGSSAAMFQQASLPKRLSGAVGERSNENNLQFFNVSYRFLDSKIGVRMWSNKFAPKKKNLQIFLSRKLCRISPFAHAFGLVAR